MKINMLLKDKVAIITGASGGIGSAAAKIFAKEGAKVVVHYAHSKEKAEQIVKEIEKAGGKAFAKKAESNEKEIKDLVNDCLKKFGRVDILVNFAGYPINEKTEKYWNSHFEETDEQMYKDVFNVDFISTFLFCKTVIPFMKKQKHGKIVNIASNPIFYGDARGHPFAPIKAAIASLTKNLAAELGKYNITVNAIAPGNIDTGWTDAISDELKKTYEEEPAMKRFGNPEEVANVALFLSSEMSSFVNGQTIVVDGGYVMR